MSNGAMCHHTQQLQVPPRKPNSQLELSFIRDQREKIGTRGQQQIETKDGVKTKRQVNALQRQVDQEQREEKKAAKPKRIEEELQVRVSKYQEATKEEEKEEASKR